MSSKKSIYRVRFINQNTVYEIYARHVSECELLGFVEIEQIIFGETTSVVVDPSEERLKAEFNDVKCTYIPMHSIVRIDRVEKEGISKVIPIATNGDVNNISAFPTMVHTLNAKVKLPETSE